MTKDSHPSCGGRNLLSCRPGRGVFVPPMEMHVGLDGRWIEVSPAFRHLLGYTEEEFFPDHLKNVMHPEDFPD